MSGQRTLAQRRRGSFAVLFSALAAAAQWRMLLWWLIALALPSAVVALPVWTSVGMHFGYSPQAVAIARGGDLSLAVDGLTAMSDTLGGIAAGGSIALVLTLLLSPWITGMAVASIRAGRRLDMAELLHGGLIEYGRMLRLLLLSLVMLGIAIAIGSAISAALAARGADAVLAADADRLGRIGSAVVAVLALAAHATIEAARGWLAAEASTTSVIRCWWQGLRMLRRRPFAVLVIYLGTAVAGGGIALLLIWLRTRIFAGSVSGVIAGLLVTQAIVAMIAWVRIARLYGFSALAADTIAELQASHATVAERTQRPVDATMAT